MSTCSECEIRANWKCAVHNVLLCSTHKRTHNDNEQEHNFIKHKFVLSEVFKEKVIDSVSTKIYLIDQFSNQLANISNILAEPLSILSMAITSQLEEQRKRYLQILRLMETEIIEDELIVLENEVAEVLVYEKPRDLHRWYEQQILKGGTSDSNRKEDCLQFGRDLIQEVLNTTLSSLEISNIYAGTTGTINGSDFLLCKTGKIEEYKFIYQGEIKNGLRHGRGNCNYSNGDVYNGEFKNGRLEGTGVYQWSNGDAYNGELKAGKREGRGFEKYASGNVYDGEWKTGKYDGRGIYKYASGGAYYGEWKAGLQEGRGVYKSAEGDIYYGEWKADLKEGRGVYKSASNDRYDGEWKAGIRCKEPDKSVSGQADDMKERLRN